MRAAARVHTWVCAACQQAVRDEIIADGRVTRAVVLFSYSRD